MRPLRIQPIHDPMNLLINRRVWLCIGPGGSLLLGFLTMAALMLPIMFRPGIQHERLHMDLLYLSFALITGTGLHSGDVLIARDLSFIGQFITNLSITIGLIHRLIFGLMLGYLALGTLMNHLGTDLLSRIGRASPDWAAQWIQISIGVTTCVLTLQMIGTFWIYALIHIGSSYDATLWQCWFEAGSAIANCGVSILPAEFTHHRAPVTWLAITPLLIIGGLGLPLWWELLEHLKRFIRTHLKFNIPTGNTHTISLHSKITLIGLACVFLLGTLLLSLFVTIDSMLIHGVNLYSLEQIKEHFLVGAHLTVTRNTGYAEPALEGGHPVLRLLLIPLVLTGAGAGSTSGGLSITLLAIPALSLFSFMRGRKDIEGFERRIPFMLLRMTIGLFFITLILGFLGAFLMGLWEPYALDQLLLQSFSAVSNSGLGMTASGPATKGSEALLTCLMWLGLWAGPSLLAFNATRKHADPKHQYPHEDVILS